MWMISALHRHLVSVGAARSQRSRSPHTSQDVSTWPTTQRVTLPCKLIVPNYRKLVSESTTNLSAHRDNGSHAKSNNKWTAKYTTSGRSHRDLRIVVDIVSWPWRISHTSDTATPTATAAR